jgi:radical SAM superfamily enzyme YgiQ (UPF0313 family)
VIRYDLPLYRPPSEARSLILQATLGCSHNRCAFCVSYQGKRFRVRPEAELFADVDWAAREAPHTRRVFLADGDAFVLSPERLLRILERLRAAFPLLERVTCYAGPENFARKSVAEMRGLRAAGLSMLFVGAESGDDEVLRRIDKGVTADAMIALCAKPQEAGLDLSITVILGLGGRRLSARHAAGTARLLDAIRPRYAAALTLILEERDPPFAVAFGDPDRVELTPAESLVECRAILDGMQADGITFRANHASNYLSLAGDLQRDKPRLLAQIDRALHQGEGALRPEFLRGL